MTVGRFAAACRLSVKTLHHYDAVGVLRPVRVDPVTGYRYYAPDQVRTALTIALLRSLDVPLPTIKEVLGEPAALGSALGRERERLRREALRAQRALASVERILRDGALAPHDVAPLVEPDRNVVALRGRASAETLLPDSERVIGELLDRLAAAGVDAAAVPVIGVYPDGLDGEFPIVAAVEDTDAVPIGAAAEDPALERFALAGGAFAAVTHLGAYEELPLAYHALAVWLHEHGHALVGPVREVYLNDPADTPPASLATRVLVPIAEA